MKYKVYQTASIEALVNEHFICEVNNFQQACQKAKEYIKSINDISEPYWRFLTLPDATYIDYGSWSNFIAIVPAIPLEEMK